MTTNQLTLGTFLVTFAAFGASAATAGAAPSDLTSSKEVSAAKDAPVVSGKKKDDEDKCGEGTCG